MAATEARPRPVAGRLNGDTMRLIPHHQDDKYGPREYRSPDGTWRVVRTPRPGGSRNDRPRWEVHERHEGRAGGWCHHAAFERRRDALVFLDTTAAASGGESVTTAPARRRETPEPSQEPPQSSPRRTPKGPISRGSPRATTMRSRFAHGWCRAERPPRTTARTSPPHSEGGGTISRSFRGG